MMASPRALRGWLPLALLVILVDQLTKHWAVNNLTDRDVDLFWTLRLHLSFNTGMAFSRGQSWGPVIGVLALFVIVGLLLSLKRQPGRLTDISIGLIIGGAIGNVIDRLFRSPAWLRGGVVDFIDFQWFPIFNVADMGITIGGGLLVLASWLAGRGLELASPTLRTRVCRHDRRDGPVSAGGRTARSDRGLDARRQPFDRRRRDRSGWRRRRRVTSTIGRIRLTEGQVVTADPLAIPVEQPPQADPTVEFDIIHEDDHVVVIDKPAGLVVHPGAGNPDHTLVNGLLARVSGDRHRRRADPPRDRAPARRRQLRAAGRGAHAECSGGLDGAVRLTSRHACDIWRSCGVSRRRPMV